MMQHDPYHILGIEKHASWAEIKRAYRVKAAKYHPDAGGDAWVFQQVQDAYQRIAKQRGAGQDGAHDATAQRGAAAASGAAAGKSSAHPGATAGASPDSHSPPGSQGPRSQSFGSATAPASTSWRQHPAWQFLSQSLPMQDETTVFILVNCLDIFMTYLLLRMGAIEANPLANFVFQRWNIDGMIYFKMAITAFVCVLAQIVARSSLWKARGLLFLGTGIVGAVVLYSVTLLVKKMAIT